uniref:hypothetical protein n=1 Tax=Marinagarivorans algicola TaxID=1513270 RepID=UPI00192E63C8
VLFKVFLTAIFICSLFIKGSEPFEAAAGDMVFWERGIDHQIIRILEHPLVFLSIDAPTRRHNDVQK